MRRVDELYTSAARAMPGAVALIDRAGEHTYASMDRRANRIARVLHDAGVRSGDGVALWLEKSAACVAAMQAVMRLNAAYVPLDPLASVGRMASILAESRLRFMVTTCALAKRAAGELDGLQVLAIDDDAVVQQLESISDAPIELSSLEPGAVLREDDLAYILYTSGSTGAPKGVCIRHRNARAFIDWAVEELRPSREDRFASHAPFHFDLSVLDIYAAAAVGASLVIVPEQAAYSPKVLVDLIAAQEVSIWYSVPSALQLMMDRGGLLERSDVRWKQILFAGEVFPVAALRRLRRAFPDARLLNLYGPTETNVCTFHEVLELPDAQLQPVPIGKGCCENDVYALREDGRRAGPGEEGELFVDGATVMAGYHGRAPLEGPYATGDIVRVLPDGAFEFIGRRDHQVKVRGHRIELGAIESALLESDAILEAAVVVRGVGLDARLVAHVVTASGVAPSLIEAKRLCATRLPRYMLVDEIAAIPEMPRTRNGKIDRRALAERISACAPPVAAAP